jgi:hypothetical protein
VADAIIQKQRPLNYHGTLDIRYPGIDPQECSLSRLKIGVVNDWAVRIKLNDLTLQVLRNSMEEIAA